MSSHEQHQKRKRASRSSTASSEGRPRQRLAQSTEEMPAPSNPQSTHGQHRPQSQSSANYYGLQHNPRNMYTGDSSVDNTVPYIPDSLQWTRRQSMGQQTNNSVTRPTVTRPNNVQALIRPSGRSTQSPSSTEARRSSPAPTRSSRSTLSDRSEHSIGQHTMHLGTCFGDESSAASPRTQLVTEYVVHNDERGDIRRQYRQVTSPTQETPRSRYFEHRNLRQSNQGGTIFEESDGSEQGFVEQRYDGPIDHDSMNSESTYGGEEPPRRRPTYPETMHRHADHEDSIRRPPSHATLGHRESNYRGDSPDNSPAIRPSQRQSTLRRSPPLNPYPPSNRNPPRP